MQDLQETLNQILEVQKEQLKLQKEQFEFQKQQFEIKTIFLKTSIDNITKFDDRN